MYLRDTPSTSSGQALRHPAKGLRPSALPILPQPARISQAFDGVFLVLEELSYPLLRQGEDLVQSSL